MGETRCREEKKKKKQQHCTAHYEFTSKIIDGEKSYVTN